MSNLLITFVEVAYAGATEEDKLALRVWMRETLLSPCDVGPSKARDKAMVEARRKRVLEISPSVESLEIAKMLKREGWYSHKTTNTDIARMVENIRRNP